MGNLRGIAASVLLVLGATSQACATGDSPAGAQPDGALPGDDASDGGADAQADGAADSAQDAAPDGTVDASPDATPDGGPGAACVNAQDITSAASQPGGTTVNGDTSGGIDNVTTPASCTDYAADAQDDVYAIAVVAGARVDVTLQPTTSWDASLELVASCGEVACLAGADVGFAGAAESLSHTFATGGTYYVVADGFNPDVVGPYTLTVIITQP